jgi:hypothetical protein
VIEAAPPGLEAVDPAVVRAHGQLVALIAVILSRAGVVPLKDFGQMLTVYAASIGEAEPVEGALLAAWAEAVRALSAPPGAH